MDHATSSSCSGGSHGFSFDDVRESMSNLNDLYVAGRQASNQAETPADRLRRERREAEAEARVRAMQNVAIKGMGSMGSGFGVYGAARTFTVSPAGLMVDFARIGGINVGPHRFSIELMSPERVRTLGSHGEFSHSEMKLYLDGSPVTRSQALDTVLHELLHAIYHVWAIDHRDDEERTVTGLATGLTDVLASNPALAAWLVTASS